MKHLVWRCVLGMVLGLALQASARTPVSPSTEVTPPPPPTLLYDRGSHKGARNFQDSGTCIETPCVITQNGAWQFPPEIVKSYEVRMGYIHDHTYRPITLFQESTTLEQKMAERLLNRSPNRKVLNLMHMVEAGKISTIYVYGLLLQHDITEGDLIAIQFSDPQNSLRGQDYYFRFHRTGVVPDFDLTLLYPIPYYKPNPGDVVQGTVGGAAFSFSFGTNLDPEKKYNWLVKSMRAVRFNLFMGLITRKELATIPAGLVTQDKVDGFSGIGITLFEFLNAGYGVNWVRSPHTFFPFVGIEVKHVYEFFHSLKPDTHSRWIKYMKSEQNRPQDAGSQK